MLKIDLLDKILYEVYEYQKSNINFKAPDLILINLSQLLEIKKEILKETNIRFTDEFKIYGIRVDGHNFIEKDEVIICLKK
jgi:hypothetical protein